MSFRADEENSPPLRRRVSRACDKCHALKTKVLHNLHQNLNLTSATARNRYVRGVQDMVTIVLITTKGYQLLGLHHLKS